MINHGKDPTYKEKRAIFRVILTLFLPGAFENVIRANFISNLMNNAVRANLISNLMNNKIRANLVSDLMNHVIQAKFISDLMNIDSSVQTENEETLLDILLYYNRKFNTKANQNILKYTLKFIIDSQRLDNSLL